MTHTTAPTQAWVSDITYLKTQQGWQYLATVMDTHTREIVGWAMDGRMQTALIQSALIMAIKKAKPQSDVIVHSDRGSQYMSIGYQNLLKRLNLIPSTSEKGSCYDNAMMESFYHTLKTEVVYRYPILPKEELRSLVFRYIEGFYNSQRIHSALGYLSPKQFKEKLKNNSTL